MSVSIVSAKKNEHGSLIIVTAKVGKTHRVFHYPSNVIGKGKKKDVPTKTELKKLVGDQLKKEADRKKELEDLKKKKK